MSLEHLLMARIKIAKLGEKSRLHWWETDAHGRAGTILLNRLFPRTSGWAAMELAMDAAAAAHRRDLPSIPAITLFDLGEATNRALSDLLLQHKTTGSTTEPFLEDIDTYSEDLGRVLVTAGLTTHRHLQTVRGRKADTQADRVVCVGDIPADAVGPNPSILGLLIAGYQFSGLDHLIVPYLRVV